MDWTRSGIFSIQPRHDNTKLIWFKERLNRVLCLQVDPRSMDAISDRETTFPDLTLRSFASWYRHLSQEYPDLQGPLFRRLSESLGNGFKSLRLERSGGDTRMLQASFVTEGGNTAWYQFGELSDGQRAMVALYTVVTYLHEAASEGEGVTLCLDEPDNYMALAELQPFIRELLEVVAEKNVQVLLISHHPEFINYFAPSDAVWLDRPGGAQVRIGPLDFVDDGPIAPAEMVARGWVK